MGRITFFISEAMRALRRSPAPSIAAMVTVSVTTVLLGVLIPLLQVSGEQAREIRERVELKVFFQPDAAEDEVLALRDQVRNTEHVVDVQFVSKGEALNRLRDKVDADFAATFDELKENPLPFSFDVKVDDAANVPVVRDLLMPVDENGVRKPFDPIVKNVEDSRADSKAISEITSAVTIVLIAVAVLLIVASILLIANTIRLSIYARRREVEVMQLVGATNWFISWPFMIEGMIVGLIGAVIAIGIIWLGKFLLIDRAFSEFRLMDDFNGYNFVPLTVTLLVAAIIVSMLGSGLTLRRFLRV